MSPASAGIGLKPAHVRELLLRPAAVDFVEVHAENYMVAGGPFPAHLQRLRERLPLSLHGVGLSIGSCAPLERAHLQRLAALVRRFEPALVSEHLAWSGHAGVGFNDLLPLPYHEASLRGVCAHVDEVQECLGRRLLIENPATYLAFESSTIAEAQFIAEVVRRTGCGLLLDVANVFISAVNHHRDARGYVEALPLHAVGEIHLAGFSEDEDAAGDRLLIDSHAAPVPAEVWALYEHALRLTGPRPTLIERDANLPPLAALCAEAGHARRALASAARECSVA